MFQVFALYAYTHYGTFRQDGAATTVSKQPQVPNLQQLGLQQRSLQQPCLQQAALQHHRAASASTSSLASTAAVESASAAGSAVAVSSTVSAEATHSFSRCDSSKEKTPIQRYLPLVYSQHYSH